MNSESEKLEDRKKKIIIISKIDELKVIANNHYLMNKYDDAIKTAREIISLAKEAKLNSIIKEQTKFVSKIYKKVGESDQKFFMRENFEELKQKFEKLLKVDKIDEAHKLVEKFKNRYQEIIGFSTDESIKDFFNEEKEIWNSYFNEQKRIKSQVDPLLIQLESYLETNNVLLAKETVNKAKHLIKDVRSEELLEKWKILQSKYDTIKQSYDIHEELEKLMNAISTLTDKYKFKEAKEILNTMVKIVEKNEIKDYKDKIKVAERIIIDATQKYDKLIDDIIELEKSVEKNINNFSFDDAISNCEQIVKIARFIGKDEYVEKYSEYLNDIQTKLIKYDEFERLKDNLLSLHKEAIESLNNKDFLEALNKFKEIKKKLNDNLKE